MRKWEICKYDVYEKYVKYLKLYCVFKLKAVDFGMISFMQETSRNTKLGVFKKYPELK